MDMGLNDSRAFDERLADAGWHRLGWSELCARLSAERDMRRDQLAAATPRTVPPAAPGDTGAGSFHGAAARLLDPAAAQEIVNLSPEGNRNPPAGTPQGTSNTLTNAPATGQADETSHD